MSGKWFILIFIGLWFVWFFTGGPNRSNSQKGLFIKPSENSKSEWNIYNKNYSFLKKGTGSKEKNKIQSDLEKAQEMIGVSSYKNKVFLKNGTGSNTNADDEYLIIKTSSKNKDRVDITGWKLKSIASGNTITIGKGSYLPYAYKINYQEPIFLYPGSVAYITTGRSPIGTSFRTNLCTGYFEQFQNFEPPLEKECTRPENEPEFITTGPNKMNDDCIDYVEKIPRCEIVKKNLPLDMQPECAQYISAKINYKTCVKNHKNTKNFYNHEWRIYLNRENEFWKSKRETIKLLDNKGNLVDTITY